MKKVDTNLGSNLIFIHNYELWYLFHKRRCLLFLQATIPFLCICSILTYTLGRIIVVHLQLHICLYNFPKCEIWICIQSIFMLRHDCIGAGARKGDSGAGLVFESEVDRLFYLRGIVSSRDKHSNSSVAKFTDLTFHIKWLDSIYRAIENEIAKRSEIHLL